MRYSMRKCDRFMAVSLLAAIALVISVPISLFADVWEPFGLQGREVEELVISPKNPEVMYAVIREEGILLRTSNGGGTWESVWDREGYSVSCIAIDPVEPSNIYIGVTRFAGSLFRSRDDGETWSDVWGCDDIGRSIDRIVVHPVDPNVIYLIQTGLHSSLHRSTDGGSTWAICTGATGPLDMDIDPGDPDIVYAWGWMNDLTPRKSVDGGETFTELGAPCKGTGSPSLVVAPSQPDMLYLMCVDEMLKSDDGGVNWESRSTGGKQFHGIYVNPGNADIVYGIGWSSSGIFGGDMLISYDGGESWESFISGVEGTTINGLVFHPQDPETIFACTDDGIYSIRHSNLTRVSSAGKLPATWGQIRLSKKQKI